MGINWRRFWKERSDLLVLFVMLSFVFGLWSFGVKTDTESEENIERQATMIYSEIYKVVSENKGVMKAVAGFYFGGVDAPANFKSFLSVLFGEQMWGGIVVVEVWKDGKLVESVSFESGQGELIYLQQIFENEGKSLLVKTGMNKNYFVDTIVKKIPEGVGIEILLDGEKTHTSGVDGYRKPLFLTNELKYGGVNFGFGLSAEDKPKDTWTVFLGLGIVLSFVIYALVFSMSTSGRSAEMMASEIIGDLMKYKKAINSLDSHLVITDTEGKVIFANPAVFELTGFNEQEVVGNTPRLWGKQMSRDFYRSMWDTIKNKREVFKGEVVNKRKNGSLYTAYAVISPIIDEGGDLLGFVGSETDITERKQLEDEQKRMNELMVGRELAMVELKKKIAKMEGDHDR